MQPARMNAGIRWQRIVIHEHIEWFILLFLRQFADKNRRMIRASSKNKIMYTTV
jgi:hypothetical protein